MCKAVEIEESRKDAVRRELELVLSSTGFARNDRQSQFLRFLVERHLEGRDNELKESVIAVEVFGRDPGYDPKLDGIVRTEAMRLRTRLDNTTPPKAAWIRWLSNCRRGATDPFCAKAQPCRLAAKARFGRTTWIVAAVVAAAVVGGATWWWTRPSPGPFTVAVLPLENLGDDVGSEYFADGLTDEIIRNLSVIDGLMVPSRTSSFALKGKQLDAGEIGTQLGADYLVEGSVTHAGDQLRVNVALIRVDDDSRLWTGRFDRKLTDVFAVQDEISRGIVNSLRLKLSPGRRQYETNLEAYDLYLRGRHIMASFPTRGRPSPSPPSTTSIKPSQKTRITPSCTREWPMRSSPLNGTWAPRVR